MIPCSSADDAWWHQHSSTPRLHTLSLEAWRPATLPCHYDSAGSQEEHDTQIPDCLSPTCSTSSSSIQRSKAHYRTASDNCQVTASTQAVSQAHRHTNKTVIAGGCRGSRGRAGAVGTGGGDGSSSIGGSGLAAPADVPHPTWVAFLQGLLDAHQRHCLLWHFDPSAAHSASSVRVRQCKDKRAGQLLSSSDSNGKPSSASEASELRHLHLQQQLVSTVTGTGGPGRPAPAAAAAQAAWPCCWPYN